MERNEITVQKSPPRGRQMDRVEQVVRSLPGIVSARAEASPDGELGSIHVLVSEQVPRYRITRAVHSALLIYLDLAIDDHQIQVAVSNEVAPEQDGGGPGETPAHQNSTGDDSASRPEARETREPPEAQGPLAASTPHANPSRSNGATAHDRPPADDAPANTGAAHAPAESPGTESPSAPSTEQVEHSRPSPAGARQNAEGSASDDADTPDPLPRSDASVETGGTGARAAESEEKPLRQPDPRPARGRAAYEAPRKQPEERVRVRRGRALHLGDYRINSSGRGGVRVQVDVDTEHGRFDGEVPAPDLDSLSLDIFAEAAAIAAERGLIEDFPSLRRPGLRVLGIEKTRVLGNVHLAVAVSGYMDDGNRTATGFAPVARDAHRAAALAALDAIERLLQHDPRSPGFTDPARGDSSEIDPFGPWSRES